MKNQFFLITHLFITAALSSWFLRVTVQAGEAEFLELQQKVQQDVLEFRDAVEVAYRSRCSAGTLNTCQRANYHSCLSTFPNPTCPPPSDFQFAACTGGPNCSSLVDYSTSSVRFPPSAGQLRYSFDLDLVESACFSRSLDDYFIQKRNQNEAYWAGWGVESPWLHFSASTGMFRIYPARPDNGCFTYDPRIRPFYVAGSSGPKNILLLLDTSGSMSGARIGYLKEAATRIVDTLTIGDRIAFIPFAGSAGVVQVGDRPLMRATIETKELLKERIQGISAGGSTNFLDAFQKAFDILREAIPQELIVDCNTAIVFLTDGENTDSSDQAVLDLVKSGLNEIQSSLEHPVYLFTYSVSDVDNVHALPKNMACTTTNNGVWSKIVNPEDIVSSLLSYHKLFALGLGEGRNGNFTAWVEPYLFFNAKIIGTTVSAPVFDRSVDPPILVGIVGIDFPMSALDRALGVPLGSTATFDRVVRSSTAQCPDLQVSSCQLEAFRQLGPARMQASCTSDCKSSSLVIIDEQLCPNPEDFPTDVISNRETEGVSFSERACCVVNTSFPSDQCFNHSFDSSAISMISFLHLLLDIFVGATFAHLLW